MTSAPLLLSFRAAAKLLGVGRNASLHALIAAGLLVPVKLPTGADGALRAFIPREQIEALARAGAAPVAVAKPPRVKRKRTIADLVIPGFRTRHAKRKRTTADIVLADL